LKSYELQKVRQHIKRFITQINIKLFNKKDDINKYTTKLFDTLKKIIKNFVL